MANIKFSVLKHCWFSVRIDV